MGIDSKNKILFTF